jgi:hypothetical protein
MALLHLSVLATITWDPFIRGVVILALFIVLLPGSVYLVLSTDVGSRIGLLLIAAALTGMLSMLALLWLPLASTAAIGRPNAWKAKEIITGSFRSQVTIKGVQDFPVGDVGRAQPPVAPLPKKNWFWPWQSCSDNGAWHKLGLAQQKDTASSADKVLAPAAGAGTAAPQLTTPFSSASDYTYVDGFEKNANSGCLFAINRHKVYVPGARQPHYAILRAQPLLAGGDPNNPKPDTSKPVTYVIMVRDLGSVRQPQIMIAVWSGVLFLTICYVLHRREKEIWAREDAEKQTPTSGAKA